MHQKMKRNYYELLDLSPKASKQEIDEALMRAKTVYAGDSPAVYSLYTKEEREQILEQVGEAYKTLTDPSKKEAYDRGLASFGEETKEFDIDMLLGSESNAYDKTPEARPKKEGPENTVRLIRSLNVMNSDPAFSEPYRLLYTRLDQISHMNSFKSFSVTSAVKGEGKTTTSLNLSYIMALEFKKKVLLLECDLKNPTISSNFLGEVRYGLGDVLSGEVTPEAAIVRLEGSSLYFLPAQKSMRNSAEALSSQLAKGLLSELRKDFDYVIVDSPPIMPIADMSILSRLVDGFILVVRAGKTPKDIVIKAANSLPAEKMAGVILNGAIDAFKKFYY